jgi:hypothetical protein
LSKAIYCIKEHAYNCIQRGTIYEGKWDYTGDLP